MADGLQSNGTPTYPKYKHINRNPLFLFDTRISEEMLATEADIERRTENRSQDMPLRLVFSGRLIKMIFFNEPIIYLRSLENSNN